MSKFGLTAALQASSGLHSANLPRSRPAPFPFWKLPLEIRRNIYSCLTDALHGNERQVDADKRLRPTDGMRMALRLPKIHYWVVGDDFQLKHGEGDAQTDGEESSESETEPDGDSDNDSEAELDSADEDIVAQFQEFGNGIPGSITAREVYGSDYQTNDSDNDNVDGSVDGNDGKNAEDGAELEDDEHSGFGGCTVSAELVEYHPDIRRCPNGCESYCFDTVDHSVYETIRNLALTSGRMVQELGEFIWESASAEFDSITTFLAFATQRPAALARLRHLIVEVDYNDMAGDTSKDDIQVMIDMISTRMNLVSFGIHLYIRSESLEEHKSPGLAVKMGGWAPLLSSLKATRFLVHVSHTSNGPSRDWVAIAKSTRLAEDMSRWLEIIWKPDYMQKSMDTEMAEYLESRNRPQQPAPRD